LEKAINSTFAGISQDLLDRSTGFGKSVADVIFSWSQTDGYNTNNALPYSFPWVGPLIPPNGLCQGQRPFLGNDRPIIAGSGDNAQPVRPWPIPKIQNLLLPDGQGFVHGIEEPDHRSAELGLVLERFARVTSPGHWMSIVQQLIRQTHGQLDKAAMTYAWLEYA